MTLPESWTVSIGGTTKDQLLAALAKRGIAMNDYARDLFALDEFTTSDRPEQLKLVRVSLPTLGLPDGGLFADIVAGAKAVGLQLCPLEVGPHLRLAYLDQPEGPYLTVASPEPCPGTTTPNGFYLRHVDGRLWLRGYESGPENVYPPEFTDFVFVVP